MRLSVLVAAVLCVAAHAESKKSTERIAVVSKGSQPSPPVAEIAAFDPGSRRLFSVNGAASRVDVYEITPAGTLTAAFQIPTGGLPNSVAVRDGVVAVAVENPVKTQPGWVKFYRPDGTPVAQVTVGALPDMLTFTPNGRRVLVANEGEPDSYNQPNSVDPAGSVSIIDMTGGVESLNQSRVVNAGFTSSILQTNPESIRVYGPNATLATDLEPEYIAVSHDSKTAWVTLQENNAIAVLDIEAGEFTRLIGLGWKNHTLPANPLDPSDRDGGINIANWPVLGMYQPDAIDTYRVKGTTYLVMANEGDARDYTGFNEEARVSTLTLDAAAFPNASTLKQDANLGRLTVTRANGDLDSDGDYDQLWVLGGRSFTIRAADGALVWDSGSQLEDITAARTPATFNSNGAANTFDTRSDNKGPEPEGLVIGKAYGRDYAFIGLERTGGVMVYDISDPNAPRFVQYYNSAPANISPEGLLFIKAEDSPTGRPLLVVSYEVSGTIEVLEIQKAK